MPPEGGGGMAPCATPVYTSAQDHDVKQFLTDIFILIKYIWIK